MAQLGGKILISHAVWVKVSHRKDRCFEEPEMARPGDKFDRADENWNYLDKVSGIAWANGRRPDLS